MVPAGPPFGKAFAPVFLIALLPGSISDKPYPMG